MIVRISSRPSPLTLVALALLLGGGYAAVSNNRDSSNAVDPCTPTAPGCTTSTIPVLPTAPPPVAAADFCRNVGYLCADLERNNSVRLQRWTNFDGTMVVHVPLPDVGDATAARDLQRAAAQGVRAWNNQPFPILADLRGDRSPHFSVVWEAGLGGTQLGVARTQWSLESGLGVVSLGLRARSPSGLNGAAEARQVRLTAAHEMGHALGLGHSDSQRDVMYPTNTATSVSARDRRSMEVLYQTPDGTAISR